MTDNTEIIKTKNKEIALLKDLAEVFDRHGETCSPQFDAYDEGQTIEILLSPTPHPKEEEVDHYPSFNKLIRVRKDLVEKLELE